MPKFQEIKKRPTKNKQRFTRCDGVESLEISNPPKENSQKTERSASTCWIITYRRWCQRWRRYRNGLDLRGGKGGEEGREHGGVSAMGESWEEEGGEDQNAWK